MATLQKNAPQISIIVINYLTPELTSALANMLTPVNNSELILIDNSPTPELKANLLKHKELTYIANSRNKGFAAAVNQAARLSRGHWIVLVNSDTRTDIKTLQKLIAIAEEHDAQVAAPKLVTNNKIESSVGYFDTFSQHPFNAIFARPRLIKSASSKPSWVDLATGGVLAIKREVFKKIGYFDEQNFFMYFEDIDLSYRLKQEGIRILYIPEVRIEHYGGKSADQDKVQKQANYQRSMHNYLVKHRGQKALILNKIFQAFR